MKTQVTIFAVIALLVGVKAASIKQAQSRKVLTKHILNDDLATVLENAQNSLASNVLENIKLNRIAPAAEDLELENIYFHLSKGITVDMSPVALTNAPVVDIKAVKPNLEFLNMGLDINLGSLKVEGSFEVVDQNVMALIPATTAGEFSLNFEDMTVTGKVGLSLEEDSFKTINYDIQYVPTNTYLTVRYNSKNGPVVSGLAIDQLDGSFAEHINRELKYVLTRIIKKQLDNLLVEFSVEELIGDTKLTESYREHAKALRVVANEYVDEVLHYVHDYVEEHHYEQVVIPDIEATFSEEVLWVTWHGEFYTRQGHVKNLASLTRTADVSLEFDDSSGAIVVFGSLGLTELDLGYDYYSAKFMGIGPTGTVGANVGENSLFLKVSLVLQQEPVISLQDLHIEYAKGINISVTGLGVLDWLVSSIATWVVGMFNEQIIGSLDGVLKDYVIGMLPNVDPNKYFS